MPTAKSTPQKHPRRFFALGKHVYEQGFPDPLCTVDVRNEDVSTLAVEIADALDAAIENEEHPWTGKGPSIEEIGRGSILVRGGDGELERAVYTWTRGRSGDWEGWMAGGDRLADRDDITGWRRMPKVK